MPPIDPNGCAVDVMTYGKRVPVKFWRDADVWVPVKWARVPVGTPCITGPHTFMYMKDRFGQWQQPPRSGEAGVDTYGDQYYIGALNIGWTPNGTYVGTDAQWLDGSEVDVNGPLTFDLSGRSVECMIQLGGRPWWGAGRRQTIDGYNDPLS